MGILKTLTINGTTYSVTPVVPASSVTLLASAWVGDGESYSQVVAIPEVTAHTKIDLQPTSDQLAEFHYKVLSFVAENNGGVVTVYAIGDKPTGDHTIQITKTEVQGTGKIRGNTVGTSMPRPDWNQTDPTKADYIKNKPDLPGGSGGGSAEGVVLYTAQTLNDDQKKQARKNIGAIGNGQTINLGHNVLNGVSRIFMQHSEDDDRPVEIRKAASEDRIYLSSIYHDDGAFLGGLRAGEADGDAVNVAQLNAAVGAIDTALDSIIAIQAELRGTITFTIDDVVHTALFGMTWAEWCLSGYNTIGAYIEDDGRACSEDQMTFAAFPGEVYQYGDTVIVDGSTYVGV